MFTKEDIEKVEEFLDQPGKVYAAAKMYIKAGLYVVPLSPGTKKLPPASTSINYGSASRNFKTIEKWFNPDNGRFAGYNIGIVCGKADGIFVVDVDRHGDYDGRDELQTLEAEYGRLPKCPVQITPNEGLHYLFNWQDNASSSTGKIGRSIDTRGGTTDAFKGHIVAYPSVVNGKAYKWGELADIPDIPPWVMERMGVSWKKRETTGTQRGNENVEEADYETILPVRQIVDMLGFVDPNNLSYDEWLRIGMAIKSQYPGEEGLQLWDEWSSKGERYDPNECTIRWEGFDPTGPVRVGTLYFHSRENGWNPSPDDVSSSPWDEIVERLNRTFAIVTVGSRAKILMQKDTVYPWEDPYVLLSRDDFKLLLENKVHAWIRPSDGRTVMRSEAEIWLSHQARREYPKGMGMYPNSNPDGVFNIWQGPSVEPKPGNVKPYLDHIKEIIANNNEEVYEWILDWVADMFQDPADPKGCAIVMKGEEGTGKGSFVDPLSKIMAKHYIHLIDSSLLSGRFSGHLEKALLVFADEVVWGGDKKAEGKLKGLVTEREITTEKKGIDAVRQHNMIRVIMASNNDWVVPAGIGSRRWCVTEVSKDRANDIKYFRAFKDWYSKEENLQAILHYFLNREITNNLRKAPETQALKHQRVLHTQDDPIVRWWMSCVESGILDVPDDSDSTEEYDWPQLVDRILVYNSFEEWALKRNYRRIPSQIVFYRKLREEFGLKEIRPNSNGVRRRKFEVPPLDVVRDNIKHIDPEKGDNDERD